MTIEQALGAVALGILKTPETQVRVQHLNLPHKPGGVFAIYACFFHKQKRFALRVTLDPLDELELQAKQLVAQFNHEHRRVTQ